MQNMILHVGHGKTGSSYIQSFLALNSERLKDYGLAYPRHASHDFAASGGISSGNGDLLQNVYEERFDQPTVVYSSEALFPNLIKSDDLRKLSSEFNLKVVVFTRNIFALSFSRWAQAVKREGETRSLDDYLELYPLGPYPVLQQWIAASRQMGFKLTVRNYSAHSSELIPIFLKDLLPSEFYGDGGFLFPKVETINRSLTYSEYEIQRVFNVISGRESSRYISDVLVSGLPNIKAEKLRCSAKTYDFMIDRLTPIVSNLNECHEVKEPIELENKHDVVLEASNIDPFRPFTTSQLDFLSESIVKWCKEKGGES